MAYRGLIVGALTALMFTAHTAQAQSSGIPVNFPPSSFTGNQYVDNAGCAFIRAGVGGSVTWVPRVDRRRTQLCNFQPTFGSAVASAPAATPAPAPVIAAAPAPQDTGPAPIQTVASTPLVQIPNASTPTARSPQVVRPAPVRATPAPARVAAPAPARVAAPAPARLQLAAFCADRTGPQPGFVSSRTGETIDCGGQAPARVAAVAQSVQAAPAPRRLTLAAACAEIQRTGQPMVNSNTGQRIVCPQTQAPAIAAAAAAAAPSGPRSMTQAQVCAEIARTGRRFVNAATGRPVICGAQPFQTSPSAPTGAVVPSTPTLTPRTTFLASNCSSRMLTVDGVAVRCGPQSQPLLPGTPRVAGSRNVEVARSRVSTSSVSIPFFSQPVVPASNPAISKRQVVKPPKGYTRVWSDGRHNPNRGLTGASVSRDRVSSRSVAPAAAVHQFVQVGAFADAANARTVGQRFMAQGLPVGLSAATSNGSAVKVVMLGPFSNASALARGLQAARAAGYNSAFTRN